MKAEEEEEGKGKGGEEDKPVVNPLEDKEPVLNPPEPVPVRLDSQPLESASSQGSAEGQEDKAEGQQDKAEGQQDKAEGQQDKADDTKVIIALCFHGIQHKSCAAVVIPKMSILMQKCHAYSGNLKSGTPGDSLYNGEMFHATMDRVLAPLVSNAFTSCSSFAPWGPVLP